MKKYVLTGGPGIGKTTVIEILANMGYQIVPEVARIIIEEEQANSSDLLPWIKPEEFQSAVCKKQLEFEKQINSDITFLDRGIIDGLAYSILSKCNPPKEIEQFARNRYEKIFILDTLPVYTKDEVRYENLEEAKHVHELIIDSYKKYGYEPIFVPVLPPEERVKFILDSIKN